MTTKKLLTLRKEISKRRPEFIMQDHHKRPETQARWRKPKGMHSKMRHQVWGRPALVKTGYRGPAAVRGLHDSGLQMILVNTLADLAALDVKTQGAIIGSVGGKRKTELLTACKQKNITVFNVKKIDEELQKLSGAVAARKEAKKQRQQKKQTAAKTATKKEAKPEAKEEMTKEQERKEAEKVIIQKGA
jgi:large subunit ribosomal protein L32e